MFLNEPTVYAGCIEVYDNVIDFSDELINILENMGGWKDSPIYENSSSELSVNKEIRSNSSLPINQLAYENDIKIYEVGQTIWRYANNYGIKYDVSFYSTEYIQALKYSSGQNYKVHYDYVNGTPRVISALLYLNDVSDGGETEFVHFGVKIKPKAGRLVIFPSNYAYAHAARPPLNNTKYVIVAWMHG